MTLKVVNLSDYAKSETASEEQNAAESSTPCDEEIKTFIKVAKYLCHLGHTEESNTAIVTISDSEMKVETRHYGDTKLENNIHSAAILCLGAIMQFDRTDTNSEATTFKKVIKLVTA